MNGTGVAPVVFERGIDAQKLAGLSLERSHNNLRVNDALCLKPRSGLMGGGMEVVHPVGDKVNVVDSAELVNLSKGIIINQRD